ncbi:MAG: hypothetical protein M1480_03200 [Bacteroidetes bacterium]|nr:hypothetical protein [Bacteroidota bacterium]
MGEYHFLESKNYYALKEKLKEFSSLKEKIVLLESEKLNAERVLHHLTNKKHSLITFIRYKGSMNSANCPELYDISRYISEVRSKKINYVKGQLGPLFIFYKYGYIYPLYNFILYLEGYNYFKKLYAEYLYLVEQEIKLCEKQMKLGFIETPIKSMEQPYKINYPPRLPAHKSNSDSNTKKRRDEFRKYVNITIDIKNYLIYKKVDDEIRFSILFISKKNILEKIRTYNLTKEKIIFLLDILQSLSRIQNDFVQFKASSYDLQGIYLFRLSLNCPELVYFIEYTAEIFNKSVKGISSLLNLYTLKKQIEYRANEFQNIIIFINSQIAFFEKRLSLENTEPAHNLIQNESDLQKKDKPEELNSVIKNEPIHNIIWLSSEVKLIDLFFDLNNSKLMPKYSDDEVLSHFVNDRMEKFESLTKLNDQKLKWLGTDEEFSYFINELIKTGIIKVSNKYKSFTFHFLNREGQIFKNLSQKYNNLKNFGSQNPFIAEAIKKIKED